MYPPVIQFETRERELRARAAGDPQPQPAARPPRYKLALLTWGAAYTVLTLILAVLGPTIAPWPLEVRTLVLSIVMVTSLTWLIMPALTRLFRAWLVPSASMNRGR
jgi:antibiotic biosynthesis monooxygenase (ABM) superfamily enzyme